MSLGIIKGFAEGGVYINPASGDRILLPFPDVTEASLSYSGDLAVSETFNGAGILSASRACLAREELSMTLNTNSLTWSHLQVAATSTGQASTANRLKQDEIVLTEVDGSSGNSTFTTSQTPLSDPADLEALGLPTIGAIVSDEDGNQLTLSTFATGSGELDADFTGTRIYVQYGVAPSANDREILLGGSANRFTNTGVYGRFFGCPGTFLVVMDDAAIAPGVDASVNGTDPLSLGVTLQGIRGSKGYLAKIIQLLS